MLRTTDIGNSIINSGEEFGKLVEEKLYSNSLQAMIVFYVDNMKFANYSYASNSKDEIVEGMYKILCDVFGENIIIGRVSSSELSIFLSDVESKNAIVDGFENFIVRAKHGIEIDGSITRLGITGGIVFVEVENKKTVSELLDNAQIAMQNAFEDDFSTCMVFNNEMAMRIERALAVVKELRDNICDSKFILKFQPLFDVGKSKLIGFEILSRIYSENYGIISPTEFVGIAEKTNLICDFDKVIFDLACKDIKRVVDMGIKNIKFSINVTPTYILKPGFIDDVKRTMAKYDMESKYIAFEITENTIFSSFDVIREVVGELNAMGISVYLDDFGSGFSNFIILQELKFARIKLDKTLIDKIENDRNNILVKKVIEIIDELGIKSVAEGVERKEQLEELVKLKCDIGQGYYFGKPMSFNQMIEYINECKENGSLRDNEIV